MLGNLCALNVVAVASAKVWSAHGCRVQVAAGGGGWALSFYWGDEVELAGLVARLRALW